MSDPAMREISNDEILFDIRFAFDIPCSILLMYLYLKALHIIFIVTWFAGLFYMPRLFIYATEAGEKPETEQSVLRKQFSVMMKRLWYGITWPSAILTLLLGP